MNLFNSNLIIRESRKAQGLTQEKLAEGICSRETIVKLEAGNRKPNWFVYREILRRLGLDAQVYQDVSISEEEMDLYRWLNGCYALIRGQKFAEVKAELMKKDAEKEAVWESGFWHVMLLRFKGYFYSYGLGYTMRMNKYADPMLAIQHITEYLIASRPDFDTGKISEYYLATHEYQIIEWLASAYATIGETDLAIQMWRDLKASAESYYVVSMRTASVALMAEYLNVMGKLAYALNELGRYEECLELAEEGLQNYDYTHPPLSLANFLSLKADALRGLGRVDESREISKKILFIHYGFDGYGPMRFVDAKKEYERQTGETLELSIPW